MKKKKGGGGDAEHKNGNIKDKPSSGDCEPDNKRKWVFF